MSGTNTTAPTPSGVPISSLPAAETVTATDGVFGIFAGKAQLADPKTLVAAGLPSDVVKTDDLDAALSDSSLGQYTDQAAQHAADADTSAAQAKTGAAASAASAGQAAQTGVQVAAIAESAKSNNDAAQQAVAGVTGTANSAAVMLTAAMNGNAPLNYRGYWNAATNSPVLSSGVGTEGDLYSVSVGGTTALDGNAAWSAQDAAWFHNGAWQYFARAGWAAFAREIIAQRSLRTGGVTLTDGSSPLEILDDAGFLVARVGADGSFASDDTQTPEFGLTSGGVYSGPVRIVDDGQPEAVLVDQSGFPVQISRLCVPAVYPAAPATDRMPTATDDSSARYAAGDLWQYDGDCLTCLYPNAGRAVWQDSQTPPVLPGDQFSSTLAAAYGTSRLVSSYTGPLLSVVAVKNGVRGLFDITQDENGLPSNGSIQAAASGLDTGTSLYVARIYDQSGAGNHITAFGFAAGISTLTLNALPRFGVRRDGQQQLISWAAEPAQWQPLQISAAVSLSASNCSALLYAAFSSCNCPNYTVYQALALGNADGEAATLTVGNSGETGRLTISDGTPTTVLGVSGVTVNNSQGLLALRFPGNDTVVFDALFSGVSGNVASMKTGFSSRTFSGGVLGGAPVGMGFSSAIQMGGLILLNKAVTDSDILDANKNAARLYDYQPQVRTRIDCFGSSTTQGFLNTDGWCWPQMLHDYLNAPVEIRSVSVAGSTAADFLQYTIANMLTDAATPPRRRMAITWYGNNDINGGQSVATIVTNNASIHKQLRSAGYERLFILGQYNTTLNAAIRQAVADGTIDADAFIDPWSAPPMSTHSDTTLYHDGTHPTVAGDRFAAGFISHALNQYL